MNIPHSFNAAHHIWSAASRVDLYDRVDLVPFEKLEAFFRQVLERQPSGSSGCAR